LCGMFEREGDRSVDQRERLEGIAGLESRSGIIGMSGENIEI